MNSFRINDIKSVISIGVGGGDLYYVSKLFFLLGVEIIGYDIAKSTRTIDLESLGIQIFYRNPEEKLPSSDLIVYSDSLPDSVLKRIKDENKGGNFLEVGKLKRELILLLESKSSSKKELDAINNSGIFPLYNFNPKGMRLIGVTGTDGKTTVVSMLFHMLSKLGFKPGMISTVGAKIGNQNIDMGLHVTTPSSQDILKTLQLMLKRGCTHVIIECTSQGLYMGRLAGLKFDVVAYTNIKRDHLGYHKTWNRYANAKSLLIKENLKAGGKVILNRDDKKGYRYLVPYAKGSSSYSLSSELSEKDSIVASHIEESISGVSFIVDGRKYFIPIIGRYNVSNALAAVSALEALGINKEDSLSVLKEFPVVLGRMNILQKEPFTVIVDFAHTPNGLLNALRTVNRLKKNKGRIILVFGCAAKRDEYKRPIMGRYAKKYADITILTAEDCRAESLKEINNQIEKGWNLFKIDKKRELIRFDDDKHDVKVRRDAIKKAFSLVKEGDIVLITGKGHERSLCFGLEEFAWNDIEEVREIISKRE